MPILKDKRKLRNQKKLKLAFELKIFDFLDSVQGSLILLFPNAELLLSDEASPSKKKFSLETKLSEELKLHKAWIHDVFEKAIQISITDKYDEKPLKSITYIPKIAHGIIQNLLIILSEGGGDLSDNGLMFIGDVGDALGVDSKSIDIAIEQVQYDRRKQFTQKLLELLTEEQLYWVTLMIWNAVHIDEKVDYREYKYFENILQLSNFEHKQLYRLKEDQAKPLNRPEPFFDPWLCTQIFRYIVEIVMIDEEYNPLEAKFIQKVGEIFGYDKKQQDEIIQPVMAALMVRKSLFSY